MDAFIMRKRKASPADGPMDLTEASDFSTEDEPTEVKLAILASLHSDFSQEALLDVLLAHDGSVQDSSAALSISGQETSVFPLKKTGASVIGSQTSLRAFARPVPSGSSSPKKPKLLSRKGATLHLYDPADIAEHTPCSVIHNFLPSDLANDLLKEMLDESKTFEKATFKLFDTVVSSPHTSSFYVDSYDEMQRQKFEFLYNGARLSDVRQITPQLEKVKPLVQEAVNHEVEERIQTRYPGGQKLIYQSPPPWVPNAAFVNSYHGPGESVGWHTDQLTYLGPRPVIGSLSLGVAREFRVRRIVPKDDEGDTKLDVNAEGQIAIHLPHNSLLVMHAEMQEEWKHSIAPAQAIDPHPIAGNRRINITYRDYKSYLHPKLTPKCKCGVPTVLRAVQKKRENWGRYFWMCHTSYVPEKEGCSFFQWADFDDDGKPIWGEPKPQLSKTI
ncbi:unnamed protein product [Discula destructiva]